MARPQGEEERAHLLTLIHRTLPDTPVLKVKPAEGGKRGCASCGLRVNQSGSERGAQKGLWAQDALVALHCFLSVGGKSGDGRGSPFCYEIVRCSGENEEF